MRNLYFSGKIVHGRLRKPWLVLGWSEIESFDPTKDGPSDGAIGIADKLKPFIFIDLCDDDTPKETVEEKTPEDTEVCVDSVPTVDSGEDDELRESTESCVDSAGGNTTNELLETKDLSVDGAKKVLQDKEENEPILLLDQESCTAPDEETIEGTNLPMDQPCNASPAAEMHESADLLMDQGSSASPEIDVLGTADLYEEGPAKFLEEKEDDLSELLMQQADCAVPDADILESADLLLAQACSAAQSAQTQKSSDLYLELPRNVTQLEPSRPDEGSYADKARLLVQDEQIGDAGSAIEGACAIPQEQKIEHFDSSKEGAGGISEEIARGAIRKQPSSLQEPSGYLDRAEGSNRSRSRRHGRHGQGERVEGAARTRSRRHGRRGRDRAFGSILKETYVQGPNEVSDAGVTSGDEEVAATLEESHRLLQRRQEALYIRPARDFYGRIGNADTSYVKPRLNLRGRDAEGTRKDSSSQDQRRPEDRALVETRKDGQQHGQSENTDRATAAARNETVTSAPGTGQRNQGENIDRQTAGARKDNADAGQSSQTERPERAVVVRRDGYGKRGDSQYTGHGVVGARKDAFGFVQGGEEIPAGRAVLGTSYNYGAQAHDSLTDRDVDTGVATGARKKTYAPGQRGRGGRGRGGGRKDGRNLLVLTDSESQTQQRPHSSQEQRRRSPKPAKPTNLFAPICPEMYQRMPPPPGMSWPQSGAQAMQRPHSSLGQQSADMQMQPVAPRVYGDWRAQLRYDSCQRMPMLPTVSEMRPPTHDNFPRMPMAPTFGDWPAPPPNPETYPNIMPSVPGPDWLPRLTEDELIKPGDNFTEADILDLEAMFYSRKQVIYALRYFNGDKVSALTRLNRERSAKDSPMATWSSDTMKLSGADLCWARKDREN